jgi:acetylornithine deacetylase/succinyl-diaminopimelate desuccinylase-like protein
MFRFRLLPLLALTYASALSQTFVPTAAAPKLAHDYTAPRHDQLLSQFERFLAIPNVAADPAGLRRNAEFLLQQLRARNVAATLLSSPNVPESTPPIVYGELKVPGATHTLVFYAHYDGQPINPADWRSPPFTPTLGTVAGDPAIYARSAGDDKAAIFAQLTALTALQTASTPANAPAGPLIKANLRFIWEGEEEAGSAHLEQILDAHKDLIGGDIWLVCDGPVDQTRQQTLLFGARGDAHVQLTVYGPNRPLHSGHYGNWAPNPIMMLAQLLAGMKDDSGRVLIPHFYDGITPLGPAEKAALAAAPANDALLRKELSLGRSMGNGEHLLSLLNQPSLEVTGFNSGQTGSHSTNTIQSTAAATIDLRLVVGEHSRTQQERVVDYIRAQGYYVTTADPTPAELINHPKVIKVGLDEGEDALRTPINLPIAQKVVAAVESARGPTILLPTTGGTVPLDAMERASGSPTITVPIANHDDNQHAANENLRLQNLWDGIETMAALMALNED